MVIAVTGVFADAATYSSSILKIATLSAAADQGNVELFHQTLEGLLDGAAKINFDEHPTLVSPQVLDVLCDISTKAPRASTIREEGSVYLINKLMESRHAQDLPVETVQKVLHTMAGIVGKTEVEQLVDEPHPLTTGRYSHNSTGHVAADTIDYVVRVFPAATWKPIGSELITEMLNSSDQLEHRMGLPISYMIARDPSLLTEKMVDALFEKAIAGGKTRAVYDGLGTIGQISGAVTGDAFLPYPDPVPVAGLQAIVRGHVRLLGETATNDGNTLGESAQKELADLALLYRGPVWDKELRHVMMETAETLGFKAAAEAVCSDIEQRQWREDARDVLKELKAAPPVDIKAKL
jgi:hypothetical protein